MNILWLQKVVPGVDYHIKNGQNFIHVSPGVRRRNSRQVERQIDESFRSVSSDLVSPLQPRRDNDYVEFDAIDINSFRMRGRRRSTQDFPNRVSSDLGSRVGHK